MCFSEVPGRQEIWLVTIKMASRLVVGSSPSECHGVEMWGEEDVLGENCFSWIAS